MKQQTLAMAAEQTFETCRKPARRDEFLKTGHGRLPIGLGRMWRIHFIQHWFNLADLACEEARGFKVHRARVEHVFGVLSPLFCNRTLQCAIVEL